MAILDYSAIHRTINGQGMILDTTPGNPTEGSYVTEQDILDYAAENTVTQGYLYENAFYSDAGHTIPITANVRFIYIDLHTNGIYRWSGTMYSRLIPVDILTTANVIDDLISTSTTAPLSANMGKELEDTKADKVSSATNGDIATLNASGNIVDSGISGSSVSGHLSNTTIHVTSSDKTTWNAKYDKPSTGIPKTDMASAVQTSLDKADSAYQKPSGGIPSTDMTSAVQTSLGKADSAYQKPSSGIPSTDMTSAVQTSLGKADSAYQLPSGGVPKTNLASDVQTSLGKADSALQTSDILNVLDSTATDKALSANEGKVINDKVVTIQEKIPSQASSSNQLADKAFVNSSISTNTANYISNNGQPFTSYAQLQAYSGPVTNNDYAFVTGTDSGGNSYYDRYKASVSGSTVSWALEYRLNNSSFTAVQWDAINSGITALLVSSYSAHVADTDIHVTTANKSAWNAKYDKPSGGIPSSDMTSAVQTSLGKADTAYQKPSGGIPSTDLASAVTTSLGKADTAYQKPSGGIPSTDMTSSVQTSLGKADSAYQLPSGGVPKTDLASAVQTSLGLADTALQNGDAIPPYSVDATAWDTTPTENSTKPVTSGGVYDAIQAGGGGGGGTFTVQITDGTNTGTATLLVDSETTSVPLPANIRATTFTATSARSKKDNISPTTIKALELISKVDIVDFNFKDDEDKWKRVGFIADDTDPILSTPNQDSMDIYNCVGVLIKAVQELYALVKE